MDPIKPKKEIRILMLEDAPLDAELAERELRKAGLVFIAKRVDRREAFIRDLDEFHPDIILSDYNLPDFNGLEALKLVRSNYPEVPVVIVTGALSDIKAVELISKGAKDYVLKDRLARLAPAVQEALAMEQGIRARKAAEKEVQVSEARFRSLAAYSPLGIAIIDTTGFSYVNPRIAEIFGYTEDDIIKRPPLGLIVEEDRVFFQEMIRRCIAGEIKRVNDTFKGIYKDGSIIDIEIHGGWMEVEGKPSALASVLDITKRVRAEESLRESEEKFRSIFDAMAEGVIMQLADGNIYAANTSAEKILGIDIEKIMGMTIADIPWHTVHEDGTPFPKDTHPVVTTLRTGTGRHDIVMGVIKSGGIIWLRLNVEPLFRQEEEKPYAVVMTFHDVTERTKAV